MSQNLGVVGRKSYIILLKEGNEGDIQKTKEDNGGDYGDKN